MGERLEARALEIAEAVLARLHGMERADPVRDVEYLEALDRAVHNGVRYWIQVLAVGEERAGDIPLPVTTQARVAARHRIPLEDSICRYTAAKEHLTDYIFEEVDAGDPLLIRTAIAAQEAAFGRLLETATEEYRQEAESRGIHSRENRRVALAERLLARERVDASPLGYQLEAHHIGLFADSADAAPIVRKVAKGIDCVSLILVSSSGELWAWLGNTRRPLDPEVVRDRVAREGSPDLPIAVGEPGSGHEGWCLTHEQARTSLWVARARGAPVVESAEVDMLTAIRCDRVAMAGLRQAYLLPLADARNGEDLRAALRAFFKNGRSFTNAAEDLGVSRQTLTTQIRSAEKCIGEPVGHCSDRLCAALELEELGCFPDRQVPLKSGTRP